jgi:hypothetical protein
MGIINVSSSDIYNKDQEKYDDVRSIWKMNMTVFILVQALSKSKSPMSSLVVLCCKIRCLNRLWTVTFIV